MAIEQKIIGVESNGRRYARNPRSTAYGPGQFLTSTWMDMLRRHRPDLLQGRSRQEALELRSDPEISAEMTRLYGQDNARTLQASGFEPNEGTTYLAHFAGPEGAVNLLKNPTASAASVLGSAVIEANPFLAGWSAQDVIDWASRKMGGQPVASAAPAQSAPPKQEANDMFPFLLSALGGSFLPAAASAAATVPSVAAAAPTSGMLADFLGSKSIPGGVANSMGYTETGGMLDNLFGGGQQASAGSSQQANPAGQAPKAPEVQASPFVSPSGPAPVDMSRLAQIIQRRAALGI